MQKIPMGMSIENVLNTSLSVALRFDELPENLQIRLVGDFSEELSNNVFGIEMRMMLLYMLLENVRLA